MYDILLMVDVYVYGLVFKDCVNYLGT